MKKEIFSIFDKVACIYHNPVYLINTGVAIRQAQDQFKTKDSEIAQHPEDFILFKLGSFDDTTAKITMLDIPETILKFWEIEPETPHHNSDPIPFPDATREPQLNQ